MDDSSSSSTRSRADARRDPRAADARSIRARRPSFDPLGQAVSRARQLF
jgi:hypothetical protein